MYIGINSRAIVTAAIIGLLFAFPRPANTAPMSLPQGFPRPLAVAPAIADISFHGPFVRDYSASAEIDVPYVENQRGPYSAWIMFVFYPPNEPYSLSHLPQFVQVGLMRCCGASSELTAFIADITPSEPKLYYKDTSVLKDGKHRLCLRGTPTKVVALVDGRAVFTFARPGALRFPLKLVLGAEVQLPGDRASGMFRDVRVKTDADITAAEHEPESARADRGITLVSSGSRYIATGWYDPTAKTSWSSGRFLTPTAEQPH
jgi:hypothetical protein